MTADEFRAHMAATGLTYRALAVELGVSLSTIYRWSHQQAPIPKLAAVRIAQLAQEKEPQP